MIEKMLVKSTVISARQIWMRPIDKRGNSIFEQSLSARIPGQLGPWTTRPVDSSARGGQLGP